VAKDGCGRAAEGRAVNQSTGRARSTRRSRTESERSHLGRGHRLVAKSARERTRPEWMAWRRYLIATRITSGLAAYPSREEDAWARLLEDLPEVDSSGSLQS